MVDFHLQRITNRAVAGEARATVWEIARCIGVGGLFLGLILTYAWLHMETLDIHYRIEELKKENQQLREMNAALRAEYSVLVDPDKIDRLARKLGLTSSNHAAVRIVEATALAPAPNVLAESMQTQKTHNE